MNYTPEQIAEHVACSSLWTERALLALARKEWAGRPISKETGDETLARLALHVMSRERYEPMGQRLQPRQLEEARQLLPRYVDRLCEIAAEEQRQREARNNERQWHECM